MFLVFMFFSDDVSDLAHTVRYIMEFFPPFNFSLGYGVISRITGNHFDGEEMRWIEGREFTWEDWNFKLTGNFAMGKTYEVPPVTSPMKNLLFNTLIFWVLAWYFDNIQSGKYFFFLSRSYWNLKRRKTDLVMADTLQRTWSNSSRNPAEDYQSKRIG